MMEPDEHRSESHGQSLLLSQLCSKSPAAPASSTSLDGFKCSQCTEAFSKAGALKQHFKTSHGQPDLEGPFPCSQRACQFSSAARQDYEAHLTTTHGLTLVPCTYRSCKAMFPTRGEMESHRRGHLPFGCFHCQFVSQNPKELNKHLLEHRHSLSVEAEAGTTSELTSGCTNENPLPRGSDRPTRKRKPGVSSSPRDRQDEELQGRRDKTKRARKMAKEASSAEAATQLPSKEYLAEGSEHIYRTHTCPICRRCFKMRSHLQEHLHLHFPEPGLQCPTCKRYFTSKSKLRLHRLREAGEKLHRCNLCEYSAVEKNAIRRHLTSVHASQAEDSVDAGSFHCPACGQSFSQSRALKAHMKTHNDVSDDRPLLCFQQGCTFHTRLRKELVTHAAQVHGVRAVECRHHACGAIFQSQPDMEAHYRTHLAYHCAECHFSCSNKSLFLQHRRLGHPGTDKLGCDFCPYVTFNPVEFQQHMGHLHANEKIHRCSQCSFVTSHKRGLKRHMLMHSGEKPHKCKLCDFRCRDESYLSKHMLTHSDDKNYMCADCGYVTKWKHYLTVHMRKHAGDLRYSCDQCSYRCHRMDQLNSHKLRHQAKSLMCEICAYACKRKYELRNHMLAKHSGEARPPAEHQCKYCSYSTCYRQALQNHENCKHTKLKEFRCALCFYSSFSSISLFLHKRKTHGYVPGDKAWLENYAAKEKERKSCELMQDFYIKPSVGPEQPTKGPPEAVREPAVLGSADHNRRTETPEGSQPVEPLDICDVVSQEVVEEASTNSPPSVNSPEEYCTLVLTRLPTPSLQNEEENSAGNGYVLDASQERTHFSTSTSLSGEDDDAVQERESEQSGSEDSCHPTKSTSQPFDSGEIQTSDSRNHNESITPTFVPEHKSPSESENRLQAMKKHDKDQADSMVLEGRVQMLVLPTEAIYRCEECSYVTCKETALEHHRQSSCHGRFKGHQCPACRAHFKQKRGLDSHLRTKCPALPRKARAFVGASRRCQTSIQDSEVRPEGKSSEETATPSSQKKISTQLNRPQQDNDSCTTRFRSVDDNTDAESEQQPSTSPINDPLSASKNNHVQEERLYTKTEGKFKCEQCSFSSVRLLTVERHVSTCRKKTSRKKNSEAALGLNDNSAGQAFAEEVQEGSRKHRIFGCPSCAFRCNQKRALDRHEREGCMKQGEVQCTTCLFVAKSKTSLSRHILSLHKQRGFGSARAKRLHCQHCAFSCKQDRSLAQHVALKHKGVRPHCCRYCPFSTTRRYRLEEHESLHTGVGRHSCTACRRTFGAATKLRQHKMRIHDRQPTHFCTLCDFTGYALDDIRRHKVRCHTGELQHVCTHCDAQFSSEVALRNHCKRAHQLQACFSCKQCDYTCSSDLALKAHHQSKHPQVKCTTCQESFGTKESLEVHLRSHLAHQCPLCPFAAKARQLLAQHLLSEHEDGPPEDKPLKCSTCQFACRHQLVFEQHLRSHGSKRLYKCTDCEYSTRNKQKITWHIRIHTGEKPYSCEQCSYSCTDPSRLKLHMRVHQEEKKYLCPQCGYKCKWATQLKYHMTKHTGEKPYACDECDYRTNRADALRAHRDTQHCDTRPYVCEKCGKAFKTSFILKTHQRQHSDERSYACGLCPKAFRWPAGLRHHYLSHTKQQPFRCRLCKYTAKQKFQVVKHLKRHHPETAAAEGVVRDAQVGSLTLREAMEGTLGESAAKGSESQLLHLATEEEEEAAEDVTESENNEGTQ